MQVLRFFMLISLIVWIGGIIFFAFVVAPTVFTVLPSHDLAGKVVERSLGALHWMGIVSGIVFIVCSLVNSRLCNGFVHAFAARNLLTAAMIALTAVSLFVVTARMEALKTNIGVIDNVPLTDSRRMEFNQLHYWSTGLESGVLLMGLVVVYLTASGFARNRC